MSLRNVLCLGAVVLLLGATLTVQADVPQMINYQGVLLDSGGDPITIPVEVAFYIWDAETDGNSVWGELRVVSPDAEGRFNVLLGAVAGLGDSVFTGPDRWLSATVEGENLEPRQPIASVGYAYRVGTVDGASGGNITSKVSIGPGHTNTGTDAFLAGNANTASGNYSAVGGGVSNVAGGNYGTVPGGGGNRAGGSYSFAAGINAKALQDHDHTFVWNGAWDIDSFYTTAHQQFLINAPGGVGINTNTPGYALEVIGNVDADGFSINGVPLSTSSDSYWSQSGSDIYYNTGNVGIGTATPEAKLHVAGEIKAIGDVILDGVINSPTDTNYAGIVIRGVGGDDTCMVITSDGGPRIILTDSAAPEDTVEISAPDSVFRIRKNGQNIFAIDATGTGPRIIMVDSAAPEDTVEIAAPDSVFRIRRNGQNIFAIDATGTGPRIIMVDSAAPEDTVEISSPDTVFRLVKGGKDRMWAGMGANGPEWTMNDAGGNPMFSVDAKEAGSRIIMTNAAAPEDTVEISSPDTVFRLVKGGKDRMWAGMNNGTSMIALADATGDTAIVMAVGPDTVFRIKGATGDSCRVTPQGIQAYGDGSTELTDGGLTFNNYLGNKTFEARGPSGILKLYNSSGVEKLCLSQYGVAFDTASGSPTAFPTVNPGGAVIYTDMAKSTGVQLGAGGGAWSSLSDRNLKENITPINTTDVLAKVAALPMSTWNYKSQDESIRHMGPMAQDLYEAFGLGTDNKHINTIDADGVALAAIQGLYQENVDLKKRVEQLESLVKQMLEDEE